MAEYQDKLSSLTPDVSHIVVDKGTERPFSGVNQSLKKHGTYLCRRCGLAIFRADSEFSSHCGWPSFDDQITNAVREATDADGIRTEILCGRCDAHLGHVFEGEGLTAKNRRHCVNSLAIEFVESNKVLDTREVILAAGCFWGVEKKLRELPGALITECGYTGGHTSSPSYQQVCRHDTGHFEAVRVVYDATVSDYQAVLDLFFQIHDPTQTDGQGPDRAPQYRSAIFVYDDDERKTAEETIQRLEQDHNIVIATMVLPVKVFWVAEEYHQHYYR